MQIIALAIFVVGTPVTFMLIWDYLMSIRGSYATFAIASFLFVPVTVFILINRDVQKAQSKFNLSRIKQ